MFPNTTTIINPSELIQFPLPKLPAHKPNTRSQETVRREVRRRSNLPKSIQR